MPPVELGDPSRIELRGLRVGFFADNGICTPTRETAASVTAAVAALADAGADVSETRPPPEGDITSRIWRSYDEPMTAADLYDALGDWDRYRSRMLEFSEPFDLLICPAVPYPAVPHEATSTIAREAVSYTTPFSLTGWPCVVVRCGWAAPRLPVGVQLVARPWHDHVALAAAAELERMLGGWDGHPSELNGFRAALAHSAGMHVCPVGSSAECLVGRAWSRTRARRARVGWRRPRCR